MAGPGPGQFLECAVDKCRLRVGEISQARKPQARGTRRQGDNDRIFNDLNVVVAALT